MKRLLFALLTLAWTGCASHRSFYLLSAEGPPPSSEGTGLGIGPVVLAEYIDRPNLVLQDGPHRFTFSEDHRWAGDLSTSLTRVIAANLGRRLGTGNVRSYPWSGDDGIRYQITLDIRQLHGGADGYAVLEAGWRVYSLPDRKLKASRTFLGREPLASDGYPSLVAAESALLSRLADDIAKQLR